MSEDAQVYQVFLAPVSFNRHDTQLEYTKHGGAKHNLFVLMTYLR